jgi:hypothetical protein
VAHDRAVARPMGWRFGIDCTGLSRFDG